MKHPWAKIKQIGLGPSKTADPGGPRTHGPMLRESSDGFEIARHHQAIILGSESTASASLSADISASRRFFLSSNVVLISSQLGRRSWRYFETSWSSMRLVFMLSLSLASSLICLRRSDNFAFLAAVVSARN